MKLKDKSVENIQFFKMLYNNDTLRMKYKHITSMLIDESAVEEYLSYLRECEALGFSYYLYVMNDRIVGFSDFALKETEENDIIDLACFTDEEINKLFCNILKEEGYFIVSDNAITENSYEEKIYTEIERNIKYPKLKLVQQ